MSIESKLAQFDKIFSETPATTNTQAELPEGKYTMKVSDVEIFTSKDDRDYFKVSLTVDEGEFKGVTVSKLYGLDVPEKFRFLKGDLVTCGLLLQRLSELPKAMSKIVGVRLSVQVKKNGQYTNYWLNGRVGGRQPQPTDDNIPF